MFRCAENSSCIPSLPTPPPPTKPNSHRFNCSELKISYCLEIGVKTTFIHFQFGDYCQRSLAHTNLHFLFDVFIFMSWFTDFISFGICAKFNKKPTNAKKNSENIACCFVVICVTVSKESLRNANIINKKKDLWQMLLMYYRTKCEKKQAAPRVLTSIECIVMKWNENRTIKLQKKAKCSGDDVFHCAVWLARLFSNWFLFGWLLIHFFHCLFVCLFASMQIIQQTFQVSYSRIWSALRLLFETLKPFNWLISRIFLRKYGCRLTCAV